MGKYQFNPAGPTTWEVRLAGTGAVIGEVYRVRVPRTCWRPVLPNGALVVGLYTSRDKAADMLAKFEEADHA